MDKNIVDNSYSYFIKDTIPDEKIEILRDNCNNLRDRAMIDFLLSTGIRVGELVRLNIGAKTKIHLLNSLKFLQGSFL